MRLNPLSFAWQLARLPFALLGWAVGRVRRVVYRRHYEAERRNIFTFWDGSRWRSVDAFAVWGKLSEEVGTDFGRAVQRAAVAAPDDLTGDARDEHNRQQIAAAVKLADAAAKAFGVPPVGDEGGLTVVERIRLVVMYLQFMASRTAANQGD